MSHQCHSFSTNILETINLGLIGTFSYKLSHYMSHQCHSFSADILGTQNRPFSHIIYHINIASMSQLFNRHPGDHKLPIFHPKSATLMSHQCRSFSADIPGTQNRPFSRIICHINVAALLYF